MLCDLWKCRINDNFLSFSVPSVSILVNTASSLKLCQFAKVFWDYTEAAQGGRCGAATAQAALATEKSSSSLGKVPRTSVWADQVASRGRKMPEPCPRPQTCGLFTPSKTRAQGGECAVEMYFNILKMCMLLCATYINSAILLVLL